MADPRADPRALDLTSASIEDIEALKRDYDAAAGTAQYTARGLRAADRSTVWTGRAADRFHATIGQFPRQLDAVCNGYWEVASAMRMLADGLRDLQAQYATWAGRYGDAAGRLARARTIQSEDLQWLHDAQAGRRVSGLERRDAAAAVEQDRSTVNMLAGELGGYRAHIEQILEEFDALRAKVCTRIHDGMSYAMVPPPPHYAPQPIVRRIIGVTGGGPGPGGPTGGSDPASATVREKLDGMHRYIDSVMGTPYVWGGGHGGFGANGGLDCSGFVSGVLHSAGYLNAPQTTQTLPGQLGIADGPGRYVTIYDRTDAGNDDHVIIDVNGQFYEEGGGASGGAPDVHPFTPSAAYLASFNRILHPAGM